VRRLTVLALFAAVGCTPGAPPAGGGGALAATVIDVSLTSAVVAATPYGSALGYMPTVATVSVGTTVQFVNRDSFAHTATSLHGSAFPTDPGFTSSALTPSGNRLSTGWTSGTLGAGASSPPLVADVPGTYLYGCFFHYGAQMRGAIVVR
jgi:plastocyanin